MVPLCIMELCYVLLVHKPLFESYGEGVRFGLYLVLLLLATGGLLGALEGCTALGISELTKLVAKQRMREPRWMAWFYSLLALPFVAVFVSLMFSGRRASQIPGKQLMGFFLGMVALVAVFGFVRLVIFVRERFRIGRWGSRQALLLVPLLLFLALSFYVADQRILARLYGFFHVGLALGAFVCAQLAASACYAAWRPQARWMGRLAEPSIAVLFFVGCVAAAAWSINRVGAWERLRFVYYEHTVLQSKVLSLAAQLGIARDPLPAWMQAEPAAGAALPQDALRPGPRRPEANIVLISIDALRADHLQTYGYGRAIAPSIDEWAKRAVVFDRAYCQVPHTSFSVTSLLTGNYIYSVSRAAPGQLHRSMAEILRHYGFKTGGFFPPSVFYIDREQFTAFERSLYGFEYVKYEYLDADKRIDQMITFLRENRDRAFAWVHFFEPHEPYDPHAGFDWGPRAVDRYDGEISYVDREVGRLLAFLRKERPQTIVAVTADHGEEFGEHGAHYHGNALYDQQIRVPLIIEVPGVQPRRVNGAVQIIDLPATLLSLADVPLPAGMRGTDLGPWLDGEDASRLPPVFSEIERKKVVVHRGHKLICDTARGFCELYDLQQDPGERNNLITTQPRIAAQLRGELMAWMASHVARAGKDEEIAQLLDRGRQRDTSAVPGLLRLFTEGIELRREAARLLTLMRAPEARTALVRAADDPDPGVSLQATVGAALVGDKECLGRLEELLARPDVPPELRRDALLAMARAGDRQATAPLGAYLAHSDDFYERSEIIEALGLLGDAAAGQVLRQQLTTLRTRLFAMDALGLVKAREAVPDLERALREDRFISWRRSAAKALGRIGDRRAIGALRAAAQGDGEADVAAAAVGALSRLGGLPAPGLRELPAREWSCGSKGKGSCVLELAGSCAAEQAQDLVLVWSWPDREALAAPPSVALRCGTDTLARDLAREESMAVALRPGLQGPLILELSAALSVQPPRLRYAGLRRLPAASTP